MKSRQLPHFGIIASCITGLSALVPSSAHAMTLFQDNFDNEALRGATTELDNWNVTSGNVDVIGPGFFDFYPGNGRYLDMGGNTNGTIETKQTFSLTPGIYQLSFDLGRNPGPNNKLLAEVGSVFSESFSAPSALTSISRLFAVTNATNVQLSFTEIGPSDNAGSVLDNVLLEQTQSQAVPTPAPLLGLVGMGVAAIRKRKLAIEESA